MNISRTFDLLNYYQENLADKPDALAGLENRQWVKYSSKDYINNSNFISYGLLSLGIRKGDIIATITNNRPEWNFLDMGIAQTGAIHLPVFTTLESEGYELIFNRSNPKLIFVSSLSLANKIEPLLANIPSIRNIYTFDETEKFEHWTSVLNLGKQEEANYKNRLESVKEEISPKDCATLIFTSGTTGDSKGVMLSHENLLSTAKAVAGVFNLQPNQKYLSILPICHVGERMANYQTQLSGCSLYYAENVGSIARDMQELRPEGFGAVPRILEKVYEKIMAKGESLKGFSRILFFWAMNLGYKYDPLSKKGIGYTMQLWLANKIVFSKWRKALGGNVKFIGVGGAALQENIERVFWAAGIKLLNMYGLTETASIITINRAAPPLSKIGTVGAVIDKVEIKIAEDGEILCKGPNIMIGYFNNETATREVIDEEGWFHTGDVGILVEDKFLKLTDRKKEIFKLSNGLYVQPQTIEKLLLESPYIDQCMVVGNGEKFASALISPNKAILKAWASENRITEKDYKQLLNLPPVVELYKSIVDQVNSQLKKDQKLARTQLVSEEWTPESGELSPTLKLKRQVIAKKYRDLIEDIFKKSENQIP